MMRGVEPADRSERKRRGAWYTPPALAALLVEQAVRARASPRDADRSGCWIRPAGTGGCSPRQRRRSGRRSTSSWWGSRSTSPPPRRRGAPCPRRGSWSATGARSTPAACSTWCVGNPPYLGQLARATSRGGRSALGGGPYADVAAEFLARSLALVRPDGGRVALVLPQSVLSSRDTGPIRAAVRSRAAVVGFWWSPTPVFDAAVTACVLVVQAGRPQGAIRRWCGPRCTVQADAPAAAVAGPSWSPLVADLAGVPGVARARLRRPRGRPRDGHRRVPPAVLRPRAVRQRRRRRTGPRHDRPHRRRPVRVG